MVIRCRVWRGLALLVLLSAALSAACSPPAPRNDFAYADTPFSLTVRGTYLPQSDPDGTPRPFAATVTAGAPLADGDPAARDLTVTFTEPATLRGVTVTATRSPIPEGHGGSARRSVTFSYPSDYGTVAVTARGEEFDGLLRFAEALLPIGDAVEVSPVAEDGSRTVTRRTANGEREAVFIFAEESAFPARVILMDGQGRLEVTAHTTPRPHISP